MGLTGVGDTDCVRDTREEGESMRGVGVPRLVMEGLPVVEDVPVGAHTVTVTVAQGVGMDGKEDAEGQGVVDSVTVMVPGTEVVGLRVGELVAEEVEGAEGVGVPVLRNPVAVNDVEYVRGSEAEPSRVRVTREEGEAGSVGERVTREEKLQDSVEEGAGELEREGERDMVTERVAEGVPGTVLLPDTVPVPAPYWAVTEGLGEMEGEADTLLEMGGEMVTRCGVLDTLRDTAPGVGVGRAGVRVRGAEGEGGEEAVAFQGGEGVTSGVRVSVKDMVNPELAVPLRSREGDTELDMEGDTRGEREREGEGEEDLETPGLEVIPGVRVARACVPLTLRVAFPTVGV